MSSYLNFYLMPKGGEKPLHFCSYCRASEIYQKFYNELRVVYTGEDPQYQELTSEDVLRVLNNLESDIEDKESKFDNLVKFIMAVKLTKMDNIQELIKLHNDARESLDELEEVKQEIKYIFHWVREIEYSDFEKVLINID